jgi:hypothetical protein
VQLLLPTRCKQLLTRNKPWETYKKQPHSTLKSKYQSADLASTRLQQQQQQQQQQQAG